MEEDARLAVVDQAAVAAVAIDADAGWAHGAGLAAALGQD